MKFGPNNCLAVLLAFALSPFFATAATHIVAITETGFSPSDLSIEVNDEVLFENREDEDLGLPHRIFFDDSSIPDSPMIPPGYYVSYTFNTAGNYSYYDQFAFSGIIRVGDGGGGGNPAPLVTISNPTNGQVFNPPATFSITATASDSGGSVANVQFFIDGTFIRIDTTATYTATATNLAPGSHTISAVATDNEGATATNTISIIVNTPPTLSIVDPLNNAMFSSPASFVVQADASDPDGEIASVQFFRGQTSLGTITSPPYVIQINNLNAGNYTFSAVATDTNGYSVASSVSVIVNTLPTVTMLTPTNGANFSSPYRGLIQAGATDSDGTIANVEFFIGTNSIGTVTQSPFVVLAPDLGAGSYSVKAVATDNRGASTTSASVNFTVFTKPVLSALQRTNAQTRFTITGAAGQVYVVEASTNLSTWLPISTNSSTGTSVLFTDSSAPHAQRFYRVRNQ